MYLFHLSLGENTMGWSKLKLDPNCPPPPGGNPLLPTEETAMVVAVAMLSCLSFPSRVPRQEIFVCLLPLMSQGLEGAEGV